LLAGPDWLKSARELGRQHCMGVRMSTVRWLLACTALVAGVTAARAEDNFWLSGNYTQNVPCKGDGTDPAEVKVQISPQEIESKVGVCTFLDTKVDSKSVTAHVECKFPAGPLMGDITFTLKPNNTVAFVDSNKTYTATLYRCPK
jgi:hypothetical protein